MEQETEIDNVLKVEKPPHLKLRLGLVILAILVLLLAVTGLGVWKIYQFLQPPPGRTNFLVLGISGRGYSGEDLTDTMMFVSVENVTGKTLLFSLPRDIWIAPLRTKLNSVYHYRGMEETEKTVGEIIGQPINYGLVIDFNLFKGVINTLGGVVINIEQAFDDYKYPVAGKENDPCDGDPQFRCRYEHIHFDAGRQTMDGDRALQYVRSRHAEGDEGTDFAREKRQQNLIGAVKAKIFSPEFLFSPKKLFQLFEVIKTNLRADISNGELVNLLKIGLRFRTSSLKAEILPETYLINPPVSRKYDNQWVLIPKNNNWEEVHHYLKQLLPD